MQRKSSLRLVIVLTFIGVTMLVPACATQPAAPIATPTVVITSATVEPEAKATVQPEATDAPAEESNGTKADDIATAVADRTPVPTPTPGLIADQVDDLAEATGLAGKSFLGLTAEDWINLAISALIVVVGYLVGVRFLFGLLRSVARRTSTDFDDAFMDTIGEEFKWLVMVLFTRFAILRLGFLGDGLRTVLDDVFFSLEMVIIAIIAFKLIDFGATWYKDKLEPQGDKDRLDPVIMVLQRLGYLFVIIVGVSIGLSHFGINITALSAVLIFVALVISLGAKDIISDVISGFIILVDQPFRVGDAILIKDLDTWGEVLEK